jgi:hypothetical protein
MTALLALDLDGHDTTTTAQPLGAARISAALDDIALALAARPADAGDEPGYGDGYFSALCFAVSVLVDEPPARVAARALRRARGVQ